MMPRKLALLFGLFLLYAVARFALSGPALARPRELADTVAYLRISNQPLAAVDFWGSSRPFVFPLLIKIAGQDFSVAAALQLGFSILSWGLLAFQVSASLHTVRLAPLAFAWVLALSLVPHLAGWDFTMMTESLSVSWFVLFLAAGIWLLRGWSAWKVLFVILAAFFLAFTRDTNAYLLLVLAGLLLLAVLLRWTGPRPLALVAGFALIFLLNNANADLGNRWIFPLINVIGRRILPDPRAVHFLQASCDMPVSPALMRLQDEFANGEERAFYEDPDLAGFRDWLMERGKSCYMRWLLADPLHSLAQPLLDFQRLVTFEKVEKYFSRRYDPILPHSLEPFFYPGRLAPLLWGLLTLAAAFAITRQFWKDNPLWVGFILLCLPLLPHLFITWHGDAMAPERHALSVGLELALAFWILVFLLVDRLLQPQEIP
jgi:hypothetical protein